MVGRPRKSLLDKRNAPVAVRFTLDEATRLDFLVAQAGLTVSDYIRACVFAERPSPDLGTTFKHDICQLLLSTERGLRAGESTDALADRMKSVLQGLFP